MFKNLVIPQTENYNNMIDLVLQAETKYEDILQEDGTTRKEQVIDSDGLWWKTLKIDNERFGNVAFEVSELARMAEDCFTKMSYPRAIQYSKELLGIVKSFRTSFGAMGSETRRDKNNSKRNYLDIMNKTSSEKIYTLKEEAKQKGWGSFLGGKSRDEIHDD